MDIEKDIKNLSAERITVGILLNHPEWLVELSNTMKPEYFYLTGNRMVFYLIAVLLQEGVQNIDSMSIMARAEKIDKGSQILVENGGIEYLDELKFLAEDYTLDELKEYSEEVINCSFKREQIKLLDKLKEDIINNKDNKFTTANDVDMQVQEGQKELITKYSAGSRIVTVGEAFDETWKEIEENRQADGVVGLPSKYKTVNGYFTYENGECIIIGARAKFGKSMFAMNEAHHKAVLNGIPVAIFDTEMKTRTFLTRILALDSGVDIKEIKDGSYAKDPDKLMAVESSKERIRKAPLFHFYDPYWDRSKISRYAKLLKLRYDLGLLIYDYIKVKEVSTSGVKEHSELGNWTIFLKDLAGELDIPVLTFAQLSPVERRLADSDKINRYASTIAYFLPKSPEEIQRDFGIDEGGNSMIYVDYNRNGGSMDDNTKGINLSYDRKKGTIKEARYQVLEDEYQ